MKEDQAGICRFLFARRPRQDSRVIRRALTAYGEQLFMRAIRWAHPMLYPRGSCLSTAARPPRSLLLRRCRKGSHREPAAPQAGEPKNLTRHRRMKMAGHHLRSPIFSLRTKKQHRCHLRAPLRHKTDRLPDRIIATAIIHSSFSILHLSARVVPFDSCARSPRANG